MKIKDKNIVELNINKEIECSAEVAKWNYWDHEHLDVVHSGYKSSHVLYEKKNYMFGIHQIQIPIFRFLSSLTPIFMVQHDEYTQYAYTIIFGVVTKTTITIKPISSSKCSISMNYKFYCNGWKKIFKPFIKWLMPKWNLKVWEEDYDVKLRREKVLSMNFKDFVGLPDDIKQRLNSEKPKLRLPIPRPKNSSRDRHPLRTK